MMLKRIVEVGFLLTLASCGGSSSPVSPQAASTNGHIVETVTCAATIANTNNASLNGIIIAYEVSITDNGDVFAHASVTNDYIEAGHSTAYPAKHPGVQVAKVIVVYDLVGSANAGFWTIEVARSSGSMTATYTDTVNVTNSPLVFAFPTSDCQTSNF